jgi:nicotinic acid mononucleotide adenylyltransferase
MTENRWDYLYDFSLSDLVEFLDDKELTDSMDRLSMLELAIEQIKNED